MPETRRIKATYYPVRQAHPRRTDWARVALFIAGGIVAAIAVWAFVALFLVTF